MIAEPRKAAPLVKPEINLQDQYSVRHWAKVFSVSELDLAIAVQRAGPRPEDVAMFLGKPWR